MCQATIGAGLTWLLPGNHGVGLRQNSNMNGAGSSSVFIGRGGVFKATGTMTSSPTSPRRVRPRRKWALIWYLILSTSSLREHSGPVRFFHFVLSPAHQAPSSMEHGRHLLGTHGVDGGWENAGQALEGATAMQQTETGTEVNRLGDRQTDRFTGLQRQTGVQWSRPW